MRFTTLSRSLPRTRISMGQGLTFVVLEALEERMGWREIGAELLAEELICFV